MQVCPNPIIIIIISQMDPKFIPVNPNPINNMSATPVLSPVISRSLLHFILSHICNWVLMEPNLNPCLMVLLAIRFQCLKITKMKSRKVEAMQTKEYQKVEIMQTKEYQKVEIYRTWGICSQIKILNRKVSVVFITTSTECLMLWRTQKSRTS